MTRPEQEWLGKRELPEKTQAEALPHMIAKAETLGFSERELAQLKRIYGSHLQRERP